jgi:hypothetical protein
MKPNPFLTRYYYTPEDKIQIKLKYYHSIYKHDDEFRQELLKTDCLKDKLKQARIYDLNKKLQHILENE